MFYSTIYTTSNATIYRDPQDIYIASLLYEYMFYRPIFSGPVYAPLFRGTVISDSVRKK